MPLADETLEEIRNATKDDNELQELQKYVQQEWLDLPKDVPAMICPYWNCQDEITAIDGIMFKLQKLMIPKELRYEMSGRVHTEHLGVQKCKERVRDVLFWHECAKKLRKWWKKVHVPMRPRQMVATGLFVWNSINYVLVVDYYSNFFEIAQQESTKRSTMIQHIKSIFARHGIVEVIISDNGPQYTSQEFHQFSTT